MVKLPVPSRGMTIRVTLLCAALACFEAGAPTALHAEDAPADHHRPVVAVVLSGGAALGLAHIGVLKVIEEMGIPVDIVVGTSMGAIVGGLYASGYSPSDMEKVARTVDWQSSFDDTTADTPYSFQERELSRRYPLTLGFDTGGFWAGRGLLGGQTITTLLEQLTVRVSATEDFDLLPRRFRAVAADIQTGDQVVLGQGRLADAMRASATIPLLFKPFTLGGRPLVDGGIVDRLPTDVARDMGADIVIAVEVNESTTGPGAGMHTMLDVLGQVSRVLMEANTTARRALSDIVITPDLSGFRRLEFSRAPAIIARGEEETRKYSDQLSALARRISATRPLEPPRGTAGGYLATVLPVIHSLRVDGAAAESEQAVRRIFAPLLGAPLDQRLLQEAVNDAYQTGRFDEIRFGLTTTDAGPGLVVETVPLSPPTVAALLGIQYEADVSQTMYNSLVLSPGLIVRDLSGKGSQLIVDGRVVDTLGAGVEYFQPLGKRLFVDGFLDYSLDKDLVLQGDTAQVGRLDRGPAAGAWAGLLMGQYTEAKAGIAWASRHYLDPTVPVALDSTATEARFLFAMDTRPAAVLPSRGIGLYIGYDQALPQLGGDESWKRLSVDAALSFPLSHLLTMGLTFSGGTDFTLTGSAPGVLGPADAFSLRTDSQFRGYQEWDVRGSHKLAGGLDMQLRLPWLNGLGTDLYVLGNLSAGTCWTDLSQGSPLHYGADIGLGVRIRRNFEVAARVCAVDSGQVQVSVDLESFSMDDATVPIQ